MPISLVQAEVFPELWTGAILPWLKSLPLPNPGSELVVLVPTQAASAYLRERMAVAGLGVIGLKVWTPGQLREHLLKRFHPDKRIALREDIGLLVTAAAEQADPDELHARAVAANPDDFIRALDALEAAGWSGKALAEERWQVLAGQARQWLNAANWWSMSEADWNLSQAEGDCGIERLLIWGFSARHWGQWPLLLAGARLARETLLCVPSNATAACAQIWQATLEERFGEIELVGDVRDKSAMEMLGDAFASGSPYIPDEAVAPPVFYQAPHPLAEGRLLAALAVDSLSDHPAARVAILLPPQDAAARILSATLDELGLSHHDTFGHFPAPSTRQRLLNAWAAWQQEPRLRHWREFARLLTELEREPVEFFEQTTKSLDQAAGRLLTDHLPVLFSWVQEYGSDDNNPTLEAFARWSMLPDSAPIGLFLNVVEPPLRLLGWSEEMAKLLSQYATLITVLEVPLSREAFLRWLMGLLRTPGKVRAAQGRNTLAALQIINYADAEGLAFDRLLCGGLAAGQWPVERAENPFLDDVQCERLNKLALQSARSGDGAMVMGEGHGHLLTRALHYDLSEEGLRELIAQTSNSPCFTYSRHGTPGEDKVLPPGDYLLKLHHVVCGKLPVDENLNQWRQAATTKLAALDRVQPVTVFPPVLPVAQTAQAFLARRNRSAPFDEYSFCFREPPQRSVALSPRDWETAVERPSEVWFKSILHTTPWPGDDDTLSERKLMGTWLRDWVSLETTGEFIAMPAVEVWETFTRSRAEAARNQVFALWRKLGLAPSLHWLSIYAEAVQAASVLATSLGGLTDWAWVSSRPKFPSIHRIATGLPRFKYLSVDFAFACRPPEASQAEPWARLLLVNITNGNAVFKTSGLINEGKGLRLALVALALEGGIATTVEVAIASPTVTVNPVRLPRAVEIAGKINSLNRIARDGVFGQRGLLRDQDIYCGDYPLATLAVDKVILNTKWNLTFPEWNVE